MRRGNRRGKEAERGGCKKTAEAEAEVKTCEHAMDEQAPKKVVSLIACTYAAWSPTPHLGGVEGGVEGTLSASRRHAGLLIVATVQML